MCGVYASSERAVRVVRLVRPTTARVCVCVWCVCGGVLRCLSVCTSRVCRYGTYESVECVECVSAVAARVAQRQSASAAKV